jgi:hypothetical protein
MKTYFLILCLLITQLFTPAQAQALRNWKETSPKLLHATEEKPARTAVLILAPPQEGTDYTSCRWMLGKKVWEQYMNSQPDVDCYFLQATSPRNGNEKEVWIEGNTIYIGDAFYEEYGCDRLLYKTIAAVEALLPDYTHFIRTNINSFFNLKAVSAYTKTHHQSMYTGPLWENSWYVFGYGILFTQDVASHIVNEYKRLDGMEAVSHNHADDCTLTALATGICRSSGDPFKGAPSLPYGIRQVMCKHSILTKRIAEYALLLTPPISLQSIIKYCEKAKDSVMLYRIREGFNLDELAEVYEYLLLKDYPELAIDDLLEYANSLPSIQEPKKRKG